MHQGSELSFSKIRLPDAPVFRGSEFLKHQVHQGITRSNPRSLMHLRNSGGNTRISARDKDTSELLRCTEMNRRETLLSVSVSLQTFT